MHEVATAGFYATNIIALNYIEEVYQIVPIPRVNPSISNDLYTMPNYAVLSEE